MQEASQSAVIIITRNGISPSAVTAVRLRGLMAVGQRICRPGFAKTAHGKARRLVGAPSRRDTSVASHEYTGQEEEKRFEKLGASLLQHRFNHGRRQLRKLPRKSADWADILQITAA